MASSAPTSTLLSVHHLKIPSNDLDKSIKFFTSILGGRYMPELDHFREDSDDPAYAKVIQFNLKQEFAPLLVELRLVNQKSKTPPVTWDFLTFAVESRKELEQWAKHFDENKIKHSPIMPGGLSGFMLAVDDGMGNRIRYHTKEDDLLSFGAADEINNHDDEDDLEEAIY